VAGCEDIYDKKSITAQRQARNFMFISITRSKGWVYLYAVGRIKTAFESELKQITKNIPNMVFVFPDEDKLQELAKIDLITNNPKAKALDIDVSKFKRALKDTDITLVKALLDLDPEFKKSLKDLVGE
jgi:superfamily I DNA and RNA helicase